MNEKNQQLALFDFDGTLTRYDSLFSFLRFFRGNLYFITKMLLALPTLIRNKLRLVDNSTAKEKLLSIFLKGVSTEEFSIRCNIYGQKKVSTILNKAIVSKFNTHILNGDKVIIVSASIEDWILPWAQQWNVEVLATRLTHKKGMLTGTFKGKNCNEEEKVKRIKEYLKLTNYKEIWAYGDSPGDEAMLSLANHKVYRGKIR